MLLKNSSADFQLGAQNNQKKLSEIKNSQDSCQILARFWIWIKKISLDYQFGNVFLLAILCLKKVF